MTGGHLAQLNVGLLRTPIEHPDSAGFADILDPYASGHVDVMRRRLEWFTPRDGAHLVLRWIPAGHQPTIEEAEARPARLAADGTSRAAFTFMLSFPPPVELSK